MPHINCAIDDQPLDFDLFPNYMHTREMDRLAEYQSSERQSEEELGNPDWLAWLSATWAAAGEEECLAEVKKVSAILSGNQAVVKHNYVSENDVLFHASLSLFNMTLLENYNSMPKDLSCFNSGTEGLFQDKDFDSKYYDRVMPSFLPKALPQNLKQILFNYLNNVETGVFKEFQLRLFCVVEGNGVSQGVLEFLDWLQNMMDDFELERRIKEQIKKYYNAKPTEALEREMINVFYKSAFLAAIYLFGTYRSDYGMEAFELHDQVVLKFFNYLLRNELEPEVSLFCLQFMTDMGKVLEILREYFQGIENVYL